MRTIFETCVPREDVLTGNLPESQFAANLWAVATGIPGTPAIYSDAKTFFAYTYPTRGLIDLVRQVFGRFTGAPGANPNLRLETSFGGGKTHNLIALWHIARQPSAAAAAAGGWLDPTLLPSHPLHPVALVGDQYAGGEVAAHGTVLTRTLWGEMAWQLGRYELLREADEQRLAPSQSSLERLLADRKVLVLLDELPRYLRAAKGQRVGAGTLADQTLVFFHLLLGYASTHDNLVVVYTLGERDDAYGRERDEIVEQIAEARSISARQERVVTPIAESEIAHVLRRRLFLAVEEEAAAEVAQAHVEHLRRIRAQGAPLPPEVEDPSFRQRLEASYPFHPEFLETLYRKTSSFPTFQWARGSLRLMAATVRGLWRDRPADAYLIHSADIDLGSNVVRDELTSRIERPRLVTAIAEDIWSEHGNAHAQEFDRDWAAKGYPRLSQRVAQAVFLHSLVHHAAPGVAGAEPAEVHLACGRPGLPFDLVDKALGQIAERFWYAEFDGRRYVFRDEPTIKKLIEDATISVGIIQAKEEAGRKVKEVFDGHIFDLVAFPKGPEEVPDRGGKPGLVLLHFDHVSIEAGDPQIPAAVEEIFQRAGEDRRFRNYQNNLVVLAADSAKKDALIQAARKVKGIQGLLASEEQQRRLAGDPIRKLQQAADSAQLEYRIAATNAYCHLFFRSLQDGSIEHYELPAQDSSGIKRQQQVVLRDALADRGKALTRDLTPGWILDRIWNDAQGELSLADLRDRFGRRPRAYLLFDEGLQKLRQTVRQGVEKELWVYVDGRTGAVYRKDNPPSAEQVRFEQDALLLKPELAAERYPTAEPEKPKPVERQPAGGVTDVPGGRIAEGPGQTAPEWHGEWRAHSEGPAPRAVAEFRDRLTELGERTVREVELHVSGAENTRRLLDAWSAVANAFSGASVIVEHDLTVAGGPDGELSLSFQGPARQFARLHGWLRGALDGAGPDDLVLTKVRAVFGAPIPASDRRFDELARDLEETYRCGPVGVRVR